MAFNGNKTEMFAGWKLKFATTRSSWNFAAMKLDAKLVIKYCDYANILQISTK